MMIARLPSWELTYPNLSQHFSVDDFPFPVGWDMDLFPWGYFQGWVAKLWGFSFPWHWLRFLRTWWKWVVLEKIHQYCKTLVLSVIYRGLYYPAVWGWLNSRGPLSRNQLKDSMWLVFCFTLSKVGNPQSVDDDRRNPAPLGMYKTW